MRLKIVIEFDEKDKADYLQENDNQLEKKEFMKLRATRDLFHEMAREFWHGLFREIAVMYGESHSARCTRRNSEAFGIELKKNADFQDSATKADSSLP